MDLLLLLGIGLLGTGVVFMGGDDGSDTDDEDETDGMPQQFTAEPNVNSTFANMVSPELVAIDPAEEDAEAGSEDTFFDDTPALATDSLLMPHDEPEDQVSEPTEMADAPVTEGLNISVVGDNVVGTEGDDTITFTANNPWGDPTPNTIDSGDGDDTISATTGLVVVNAEGGDDQIEVGRDSLVYSGAGNDLIEVSGQGTSVDGGTGHDRLVVDVTLGPQQSFPTDELGPGFFQSLDTGISLRGGEEGDVFVIEANLDNVQVSANEPMVIATIEDFDPSEDHAIIKLSGTDTTSGLFAHWLGAQFEDLDDHERPDLNGATTQHTLDFARFEMSEGGDFVDAIFEGTGLLGDTLVTQKYAVRFAGNTIPDVSDITIIGGSTGPIPSV